MRTQRLQDWEIVEDDQGRFSVTKGRRPVATGLGAIGHAKEIVRRSRRPGEKVTHVEPDGYRNPLSKEFTDVPPKAARPAAAVPLVDDPHPVRTRYLARYGRSRKAI